MKELEFLNTIKNLSKSSFLGDDCAYIKSKNIVITQDNFVEDVHFKTCWASPFQIGYKATIVNISDILASGAKPLYLSIGISVPENTNNHFIEELYKGILKASNGAEIIGGDITAGKKCFISITAIGDTTDRNISSRSFAKEGYFVITNGNYGYSAEGFEQLCLNNLKSKYVKYHLEPKLNYEFSEKLAIQKGVKYAMMDTSDGLADALFKIADASNVTLDINYDEIKHSGISDKNQVLFGGEDYNLLAVVPEKMLKNLTDYYIIGRAVKRIDEVRVILNEIRYSDYDEMNTYNHFKS